MEDKWITKVVWEWIFEHLIGKRGLYWYFLLESLSSPIYLWKNWQTLQFSKGIFLSPKLVVLFYCIEEFPSFPGLLYPAKFYLTNFYSLTLQCPSWTKLSPPPRSSSPSCPHPPVLITHWPNIFSCSFFLLQTEPHFYNLPLQ